LILREAGSGSRWCLEEALAKAGKSAKNLRVVLEMGSNEAIKEAVRRGLGTAVLSSRVIEQEVADGHLQGLRIAGLPLKREMYVVTDRRRVLPIAARLFVDYLAPSPRARPDA
jgi:DNA-binding transcriptional LysR family regulator